jgi:hypothetical protein
MSVHFGIIIILILLWFSPLILGSIFLGWQKKIKVKHKQSGVEKYCHTGYSWTYFFFGFFVPIFRGEISIGAFHLIFTLISFGLFQLVMPFLYNKQSSIRLLTGGWDLNDTEKNNTSAKVRIGISF